MAAIAWSMRTTPSACLGPARKRSRHTPIRAPRRPSLRGTPCRASPEHGRGFRPWRGLRGRSRPWL
jgi:hypothetical protein